MWMFTLKATVNVFGMILCSLHSTAVLIVVGLLVYCSVGKLRNFLRVRQVLKTTDFWISSCSMGANFRSWRLCLSDNPFTPVADFTSGTAVTFWFHTRLVSSANPWYFFYFLSDFFSLLCVLGMDISIRNVCFSFLSVSGPSTRWNFRFLVLSWVHTCNKVGGCC